MNRDVNVPLVKTQDGKEFDPKHKSSVNGSLASGADLDAEQAVQAQESKRRKRRILKVSVYCMFGIIAMGVFVIWLFHKDPKETLRFGSLFLFTVKLRRLEVKSSHGEGVLYGDMGRHLLATTYDHCWHDDYKDYDENCKQWLDMAKLHVEQHFPGGNDTEEEGVCYTLRWVGLSEKFIAEDCFYLQRFHWYGVLTNSTAVWPIENVQLQDHTQYYDEYPSVQNENLVPIWYGSQGVAIFIDSGFPFSVSWNVTKRRQFCVKSELSYDPQRPNRDLLRYTVCQADSIKEVYQVALKHRRQLDNGDEDFPTSGETHDLLRLPIHALSTYSELEELIDEMNELTVCSLFEIYDDWENESYGDLEIKPELLSKLEKVAAKNFSCRPILPISTFFTYSSRLFKEGVKQGYFVRDEQNLVTRMVLWREREGAVLDVTNPDAAEWFLGHVKRLTTQLNVKALKLLHLNIPPDSSYHDLNMTHLDYTRIFHRDLGMLDGVSLVLERATGFISLPVYTPVRTRFHNVSNSSCLNNSVPYSLMMGLSGYPLLIADADLMTDLGPAEFMRWLQLAVFFPVLEIPNLPLLKKKSMQNVLREILELRRTHLLPYLERIWREEPGMPILRPLLWYWPDDPDAQAVGDQFMVGDRLLVAPVLCNDTNIRRVYFPEGEWVSYPKTETVLTKGFKTFYVEDFKVIPFFMKYPLEE